MGRSDQVVTIVAVEDDDLDFKSIQRVLRKANIHNPLFRAFDGVEALDLLRGSYTSDAISPPYIILLDLSMPRKNGFEFLRELRADPELSKSTVIVMSSSEALEDVESARELRVKDYIFKSRLQEDISKVVDLIKGFEMGSWCPSGGCPA